MVLLFRVYCNDLEVTFDISKILTKLSQYADDTSFGISTSTFRELKQYVQDIIDKMSRYCRQQNLR